MEGGGTRLEALGVHPLILWLNGSDSRALHIQQSLQTLASCTCARTEGGPYLRVRRSRLLRLLAENDFFSEDREVHLVCCEGEHDEVRVEAVQHVALVRIEQRLRSLVADETHDLMLPLPLQNT